MRKLLGIILMIAGFSCNPYQPYYFTHYHINAGYDPGTNRLSASVQMVLVPGQAHRDSIVFQLNEAMEILSLTAQELEYYEFQSGRLVLYIEEEVLPGEQLHISLAYEGRLRSNPEDGPLFPSETHWYPVHSAIEKMTFDVQYKLPEPYGLEEPWIRKGDSWHWETEQPLGSMAQTRLKER